MRILLVGAIVGLVVSGCGRSVKRSCEIAIRACSPTCEDCQSTCKKTVRKASVGCENDFDALVDCLESLDDDVDEVEACVDPSGDCRPQLDDAGRSCGRLPWQSS